MAADAYTTVKVQGLKELGLALQELPQRIGRNVLRGAVAAGAAMIREEARTRAPLYTGDVGKGHPPRGTLKRSIIIKQIPERSGPLEQMFYVTVRHGKRYSKQGRKGTLSQDAYYWKWVEFGHWVNTTGRALGGTNKDRNRLRAMQAGHTTRVAPQPFMRPAFETKKLAAAEAIKAYMEKRIPAEVDKLPRLRILW